MSLKFRSSRSQIFFKISVLKNITNFSYLLYSLPFPCFSCYHIFHIFNFFSGPAERGNTEHFRICEIQLKIYSKTEMCPRLASVPLTISYHLDFLHIFLTFGAYLHHGSVAPGQWGEFRVKNAILSVRLLFRRFLLLFFFLRFCHFQFLCCDTLMQISKSPYMFVFKWK